MGVINVVKVIVVGLMMVVVFAVGVSGSAGYGCCGGSVGCGCGGGSVGYGCGGSGSVGYGCGGGSVG